MGEAWRDAVHQQGRSGDPAPLTNIDEAKPGVLGPDLAPPGQGSTPEATKVTKGLEVSWGWGCSASGGLGLQNLRGGCRGDGAGLCSVVPSDRTGGNGHGLGARIFIIIIIYF